MLKKDNWILGIALGILVPAAVYGLILVILQQWGNVDPGLNVQLVKRSTLQLAGVFANMFTFRYYMVNLKFDKTGRGILLATFAYAGIFVYQNVF